MSPKQQLGMNSQTTGRPPHVTPAITKIRANSQLGESGRRFARVGRRTVSLCSLNSIKTAIFPGQHRRRCARNSVIVARLPKFDRQYRLVGPRETADDETASTLNNRLLFASPITPPRANAGKERVDSLGCGSRDCRCCDQQYPELFSREQSNAGINESHLLCNLFLKLELYILLE